MSIQRDQYGPDGCVQIPEWLAPCPACDGDGVLTLRTGYRYRCPFCDGDRYLDRDSKRYAAGRARKELSK